MKKIHLKNLVLVILVLGIGTLNSCKKSTKSESQSTTEIGSHKITSLSEVVEHYIRVKDELVKTNPESVAEKAIEFHSGLSKTADTKFNSLKPFIKTIKDTKDVEAQRLAFKDLSAEVFEMVKKEQGSKTKLYKQFCPMAFDNTGAFWLSTEKEILNPYFGDKMLHCGYVKEEL